MQLHLAAAPVGSLLATLRGYSAGRSVVKTKKKLRIKEFFGRLQQLPPTDRSRDLVGKLVLNEPKGNKV